MDQQRWLFCLGGHDLEMATIRDLVLDRLGPGALADKHLSWGARASAYMPEIAAAVEVGCTPVLVELALDLPQAVLERTRIVDHHGALAGRDKPSSLRQVFQLLGLPAEQWTREYALIEANDVGHIAGLQSAGATSDEIAAIRARDRNAQGISEESERLSRLAVARATRRGRLTVVETAAPTSSVIADLMHPALGGAGADNLLVLTPETVSFFGDGHVITALEDVPGCWWGGALPEHGFWGIKVAAGPERTALVERVAALAG